MRALLLASTALALSAGIAVAQTAITPGSGTLTDAGGNVWLITASGSIQENGRWTPGGGGTAALTVTNGTVYGLDSSGKGWFTLSGNGQWWTASEPPVGDRAREGGVTLPTGTASAGMSASSSSVTAPTAQAAAVTPATATPATCAATPGGAASGGFTTANGQIIAPDGSVYIAKGINLYDQAIGSASQVLAAFPGLNFIRLAAYSYSDTSSYLSGFISQMSARHVVVEIEHHIAAGGGVPALTGSALSAENAWFQELASAFKGNPYVWFGTINEPASGGGLAAEQASNYQAIRGTGNTSIIMLSEPIEASTAGMTNVVIDQHFYGWTSGYSTDQATVTANLMQTIKQDQQATGGLPVIIGETGPSTNGSTPDPNGQQVLTADMSSGYGAAFWNWNSEAPQDNLTQNGQMTSYGQTVAGWIALVANAPASIWSTGCGAATTTSSAATGTAPASASLTVASAGTPDAIPAAGAPAPAATIATVDETAAQQQVAADLGSSQTDLAAATAQARQTTAAADAAAAAAQARIDQLLSTVGQAPQP
jgi:hypothetical protein